MNRPQAFHALVQRLVRLASLQRWNDKLRPVPLWELDKQAHKAMIAYLLARLSWGPDPAELWEQLVHHLLFGVLLRSGGTDLKPAIQRRIDADPRYRRRFREEIGTPIRKELEAFCPPLARRWEAFLFEEEPRTTADGRPAPGFLVQIAHFLATDWEFRHILQPHNPTDPEMQEIADEHRARRRAYEVQAPAVAVLCQPAYRRLVDALGRLRYQRRWAHVVRLPETTVLGHSLFVALVTLWFLYLEQEAWSPETLQYTFFTALFHDLPEAFTRDIVRPVKRPIAELIRDIEAQEMDRLLVGLAPDLAYELKLFTGLEPVKQANAEFLDLRWDPAAGTWQGVETPWRGPYEDRYRLGSRVRVADETAAFMEIQEARNLGLRGPVLERAHQDVAQSLQEWQNRLPELAPGLDALMNPGDR